MLKQVLLLVLLVLVAVGVEFAVTSTIVAIREALRARQRRGE